jgi:1-aminocyclopropane-1-carboxylate deaminase
MMTMLLNEMALEQLNFSLFAERKLNAFVLRVDRVDTFISGNKWFKLKYNLEEFRRLKKEVLITFGGAFSNHIVATAAAGKKNGIKTIGIIRGDELNEDSNERLRFAADSGMKLFFVSRDRYKLLRINNDELYDLLDVNQTSTYILPEGGSNTLAVKGCEEIVSMIDIDFDYICCACGTGATLAGIVNGINQHQTAIGISVLNGKAFLEKTVRSYCGEKNNFRIIHDYHFGGYANTTRELEIFCSGFSAETGIDVEPVYTGKLFYAIQNLAEKNFFEAGKTIVIVHSGGIFPSQNNTFQINDSRH